MTAQIHVYPKVERQLASLERQANAPAIAAERARQIIDDLIRGQSPARGGLMRPTTDRRVKNSLKFNLGSGFRLVCIREKEIIYVMFMGDHDSADAWLDHFTRKKPHKTDLAMDVFSIEMPAVSAGPPDPPAEDISCLHIGLLRGSERVSWFNQQPGGLPPPGFT